MEMAGEDASMDAAVQAIMQKMPSKLEGRTEDRIDTRENREDRDLIERDTSTDLEESEREEREQARAKDGKEPQTKGDAEGDEGQEAAADDDAFIELPPAEEGAEPERVPLKEAVAALQKVRQMDGDIAQAVTRIEMETQAQADSAYEEIVQMHETVRQRSEAALKAIPAPQPPPRWLRDPNHPQYDPERYADLMLQYEDQSRVYGQIFQTMKEAEEGKTKATEAAQALVISRESERLARYWPEWKDEAKRIEIVTRLNEGLHKHFGIRPDDKVIEKVPFDHRILLAMDAAIKAKEAPKKAIEVKKAVQEKAAKIVNGRLPPRDPQGTGRFISEARKELRETGSEDAFAKMLLRSGALKGL